MKYVNIEYYLTGKKFSELFDIELKIINFIYIIEVSHNININSFEMFYLNQKIGNKFYKWPMKDIIRMDPNPVFFIEKIIIKKELDFMSDKKLKIKDSDKNIEISVENYYSKVELTQILENLLKYEKDWKFTYFDEGEEKNQKNDKVIIKITDSKSAINLFKELEKLKM